MVQGCLGFGGGFIYCASRNVGGKTFHRTPCMHAVLAETGEAKWTFAGWAEKKRGNGLVLREGHSLGFVNLFGFM
uniref:Uncharacterized protein n=1 Tax=Oryza punctata TaxID=4537 RepID=A0A0E0L9K9_ORYPU